MLIPMLGSTGAAVGVFIGEAAIWLPLRRVGAESYVVSAFRRTITVRLKPDTTHEGV